jgi:hypothetical protein
MVLGQYPGIKKSEQYRSNDDHYNNDKAVPLYFVSVTNLQICAPDTDLADPYIDSVYYIPVTFLQLDLSMAVIICQL